MPLVIHAISAFISISARLFPTPDSPLQSPFPPGSSTPAVPSPVPYYIPEESEIVLVKNLDSGMMEPADKLYDDYRKKGGVINPLAYQIYRRTTQASPGINPEDGTILSNKKLAAQSAESLDELTGQPKKRYVLFIRKTNLDSFHHQQIQVPAQTTQEDGFKTVWNRFRGGFPQ